MIEFIVTPEPSELRRARHAVRGAITEQGLGQEHASDVAAVVDELISAARECRVKTPLTLTVTTYPRHTSVRLRCDRNVEMRDEPFEIRERLLGGLALAFGRRGRADGTVDLWAEIAR